MLREAWKKEPGGRKVLWITAAVVVIVLFVATVWSLATFLAGSKQVSTGDTMQHEQSVKPDDEPAVRDDEPETDTRGSGEYTFDIDGTGMAVMPVTTDPAEAAAGAAAVMWNVPAPNMTRQEFFDEAIKRITYPSPDYVGPEGEIHTMILGSQFGLAPGRAYLAPDEALAAKVKKAGEKDHAKPPIAWTIADGTRYDSLRRIDVSQTGVPVLVMSEDEMREWSPVSVPATPLPADIDFTPDTPGATFSIWYVLTELNDSLGEEGAGERVGLALYMWCDAPEQGGICGVASTAEMELPLNWPESSR